MLEKITNLEETLNWAKKNITNIFTYGLNYYKVSLYYDNKESEILLKS